jgi:hypothetical protein
VEVTSALPDASNPSAIPSSVSVAGRIDIYPFNTMKNPAINKHTNNNIYSLDMVNFIGVCLFI